MVTELIEKTNKYRLENDYFRVFINPADGMNLYQLFYKDIQVISFDEIRYRSGATYGIPILFPTPNRTKDSIFTFENRECTAKMHGIARKASFQITETEDKNTETILTGCLTINEESLLYKEYPFLCTLKVSIALKENELHYIYEVINEGKCNMPFGFGIHPFFNKLNEQISICVNANKVMEKDECMLPTGKLLSVYNTSFDLLKGRQVNNLALDDVYTDLGKNTSATIDFRDFKVGISADESFTHMVVYTPQDEPFFCIEPQTCSTNAINLYNHGGKQISGLCILAPGERNSGEVIFRFN